LLVKTYAKLQKKKERREKTLLMVATTFCMPPLCLEWVLLFIDWTISLVHYPVLYTGCNWCSVH
jgi:hypothetical protein